MSSKSLIKQELLNSELLVKTTDNLEVRITTYSQAPNTLQEIARLRELTFKKIGEGTGKDLDIDRFDEHYKHLILLNKNNDELIGAYRICIGTKILTDYGLNGFYTSTLFDFSDSFVKKYLPYSIELGRSFIQPRYWKSNALDSLWCGIGALIRRYPDTVYLFGAASISNELSEDAKYAIVYYYLKWFGFKNVLAVSKNQFKIPDSELSRFAHIFNENSAQKDYLTLKQILKPIGFRVPILFKQYTDLCEKGGVKFLDFGVDESFNNCVDGLILVDIRKLKKEKRDRYINIITQNKILE